jgi:hypothetical protein
MSVRLGWKWRDKARKLVCLFVLMSICTSFCPLPVGSRSGGERDHSIPFPCEHRSCGCRSAEQCWRSCCCFTNSEKLAWARSNGIAAPDFVVAAAAEERRPSLYVSCSGRSCSPRGKSVDRCTADLSRSPGCCHHDPGSREHQRETFSSAQTADTVYVIGVLMQKCQGHGPYWNSLPWAVLPRWELTFASPMPVEWQRPCSVSVPKQSMEPPDPPPRLASCT